MTSIKPDYVESIAQYMQTVLEHMLSLDPCCDRRAMDAVKMSPSSDFLDFVWANVQCNISLDSDSDDVMKGELGARILPKRSDSLVLQVDGAGRRARKRAIKAAYGKAYDSLRLPKFWMSFEGGKCSALGKEQSYWYKEEYWIKSANIGNAMRFAKVHRDMLSQTCVIIEYGKDDYYKPIWHVVEF